MVAVENSSTTQKDAESLYGQAAAILSEAMAEAASLALFIAEKWGEPLQTVCKRIADDAGVPDAWNALRRRAQRMQKPRSEADSDARPVGEAERISKAQRLKYVEDTNEKARIVREAMQSDPDLAFEIAATPEINRALEQTQEVINLAHRDRARERAADTDNATLDRLDWIKSATKLLVRASQSNGYMPNDSERIKLAEALDATEAAVENIKNSYGLSADWDEVLEVVE